MYEFVNEGKKRIKKKIAGLISERKKVVSEGYYAPDDHFRRPSPNEEAVLHKAMKVLGPTPENPLKSDAFKGDGTCPSCGKECSSCDHQDDDDGINDIDADDPNAIQTMREAAKAGHEIEIHFDDHDDVFQIDGHVLHELFEDVSDEELAQALKSYERFNALLSNQIGTAGWEEVKDDNQ